MTDAAVPTREDRLGVAPWPERILYPVQPHSARELAEVARFGFDHPELDIDEEMGS